MKQFGKYFVHFFNNKSKHIFFLVVIAAVYFFISKLPYLNVLLSISIFSIFFFLIPLLLIFKPSEKGVVIMASILTVFAVIASILSFDQVLEIYGNTLFILLLYILLGYVCGLQKEL